MTTSEIREAFSNIKENDKEYTISDFVDELENFHPDIRYDDSTMGYYYYLPIKRLVDNNVDNNTIYKLGMHGWQLSPDGKNIIKKS